MNILIIGAIIIIYGILAVFSVSIYESFDLTSVWWDPSNYFYFIRQIVNIWLGVTAWYIVYKSNINLIRKLRPPIIIVILILQLLLFTPLGQEYNGARLWLNLPFWEDTTTMRVFQTWICTICVWLACQETEDTKYYTMTILISYSVLSLL